MAQWFLAGASSASITPRSPSMAVDAGWPVQPSLLIFGAGLAAEGACSGGGADDGGGSTLAGAGSGGGATGCCGCSHATGGAM